MWLGIPVAVMAIMLGSVPDHASESRPAVDVEMTAKPLILKRGRFTYCPSPVTGSAMWVAERLTPDCYKGNAKRDDLSFHVDDFLPAELRLSGSDFQHSGYDVGHYPPAENYHNQADMEATFCYSVTGPQNFVLNRGLWAVLEKMVRGMGGDDRTVDIVTMPLYLYPPGAVVKTFGPHHRPVPTHFQKAVYVKIHGKPAYSMAWRCPNEPPGDKKLSDFRISVREFERLGLIDAFFWEPAADQDRLEAAR